MLKLVRMVQKLKNDKNRDDSLLFQTAHLSVDIRATSYLIHYAQRELLDQSSAVNTVKC